MADSMNTIKTHPILLQKAFNGVYIDNYFSVKYYLSTAIFSIAGVSVAIVSIYILCLGILVAFFRISVSILTAIFIAFSIPDFIYGSDVHSIILHYVLFVAPTAIRQLIKL